MLRPSEACWLCWAAREMLPLGRIRAGFPGLDLAVAVEAVDLTVLDRVMPAGGAAVDLTVLEREMGAAPADLTVLARELGRPVGVLVPDGSGDKARLTVTVL